MVQTITFALFWYPCSMKKLNCFGGTPIRGRSCQAQPCRHFIQAIMVWLCSTKKALRGFRMSKKLSSTCATTFWFTFSSYTPKALSTSSLCFMAFLPPFPLKGDYQGVNFLTRLLVRRVEVQMVSHFLHSVQNIFLSLVLFWNGRSFLHKWDYAWTSPLLILFLAHTRRLFNCILHDLPQVIFFTHGHLLAHHVLFDGGELLKFGRLGLLSLLLFGLVLFL